MTRHLFTTILSTALAFLALCPASAESFEALRGVGIEYFSQNFGKSPASPIPDMPSRALELKSVRWTGASCGNAGCSEWKSDTGIYLKCAPNSANNSGCASWDSNIGVKWTCGYNAYSNAGCREWRSNTGIVWACGINSMGNGGCREWLSNMGVTWTCDFNAMSNAGCKAWRSNSGFFWRGAPNACGNAGCNAWEASAKEETFLPFFVQSYYDEVNRSPGTGTRGQ